LYTLTIHFTRAKWGDFMGRLEGKVIIVTGAGRGLGEAIAHKLAGEGAHIIALGRDSQRLANAIAPLGDRATAIAGDLGVAADVDRVFGQIRETFGKIDALINNAAIYDVFSLEEAEPARIRKTIDANLLAPMLCIRAAAPLMRKAGGGDIINMSSESAESPYLLLSAYAATKAGLETLSRAMSAELRPDNIRVTALRLAAMKSASADMTPEIAQRFIAANANQPALQRAMKGGLMELDTVAQTVLFLLTLPADSTIELLDLRPRA
jgi:meso-butanediol dehydrogenase / (S,S)-butanediol dehydrogenase / diacetyl reductase